jgi:uncharacterized short protein YbdD (DUF466 family)
MKQELGKLWHFIRELSTDDAYETYLEHHQQTHADTPPLDRRAFYLRQQQEKWSGVKRCC